MNRRILLWISVISLALFIYKGIIRPVLLSVLALPDLPGGIDVSTALLLIASFTHALYALGVRHTLIFATLSAVISWTFEQVGVATGAIYGAYHYTDYLGVKLGHVPLQIPMAWFMMIYPSYIIANLIADGRPTGSRGGLGRIAGLSFLTAMVMTAWDLVVDPMLSGPAFKAWIWEQGGPYLGVPTQNFVGWLLTTFTVYGAYRLYERRSAPRPMGTLSQPIVLLPLSVYGSLAISNTILGEVESMPVIAAFVIGLPLAAAGMRLFSQVATE
jgi:uncharacterized membrane protein